MPAAQAAVPLTMLHPPHALQQAPKGQEPSAVQDVPAPAVVPAGHVPLQIVEQVKAVALQQIAIGAGQTAAAVQEVPAPAVEPAAQAPP